MRSFRPIDGLVYVVVRTAFCVIQVLSLETCQRVAGCLAWIANDLLRVRESAVQENLQHVFPDWSPAQRRDVSRRMWSHLLLMICEVAHARRKLHRHNYRSYVHIRQRKQLLSYLLDGRPLVLVTGHFGNFEVAGYIAGLLGFPSYAVARRIENAYIDQFINRFRESTGQYILPQDGSAKQIQAVLEQGGILSLLADQHAGRQGCWVPFMGRPASCHKAVALFTLTSNAPLLVTYLKRTGGPLEFELGLEGIADPESLPDELAGVQPLTLWYNERLEVIVRSAPEQYWWLHRRWKKPPPKILRRLQRQADKAA